MREFKVERDFTVDGYRCVVVGQSMGHRCGYIGLPKGHPYYGKDYDDIDVEVHGGWTYAGKSEEYPVESNNLWWIGFDCAHYMDAKDIELIKSFGNKPEYEYVLQLETRFPTGGEVRTIKYVENELRDTVKQLKERI